jgi:hypothetical protein
MDFIYSFYEKNKKIIWNLHLLHIQKPASLIV